jgi:hypothetical protein
LELLEGLLILLDFAAGSVAESADFVVELSDGSILVFGAGHLSAAAMSLQSSIMKESEDVCQ